MMSALQEWKQHPVTRQIIVHLNERIVELHHDLPYLDLNDLNRTALQNSYYKGCLNGISALNDAYEDLLLQESKENNND